MNLIDILKNKQFLDILVFDKKKFFSFLVSFIISSLIYVSFPLITQIFVRFLFHQDVVMIISITCCIFLYLLFKMWLDFKVRKYKVKLFLKIEKSIKEKIYEKYGDDLSNVLKKKSYIITKNMNMFLFFIKIIFNDISSIVKILGILILILFFDKNLLLYFLISVPFLILLYFLYLRSFNVNEKIRVESNFLNFLYKNIKGKTIKRKDYFSNIEKSFRKNYINKTNTLKEVILFDSFVGFYRLFYLCYFAIRVAVYNERVVHVIVGLLYITYLIRPIIMLIKNSIYYRMCSRSYSSIVKLFK
jgi:hypothetical protein